MKKIKVGIAGAAGYTGCELIRLLEAHPFAEISWLMTGETHAGKNLKEVFPHLRWALNREFAPFNPAESRGVDAVFMAMPHGVAVAATSRFFEGGARVIDLSADYRLKDPAVYQQWYQKKHDAPALLAEAVYGLAELNRERLKGARLVAVPGCYPTVSILALAPVLKHRLVRLDSVVIDAKSGVSGAGRGLTLGTHFAECNEDFLAYKPLEHRHLPEIEQELSLLAGERMAVRFVPHLVPMTRGMLATIYCRPVTPGHVPDLQAVYRDFYRDEPFVQVLEKGELPRTKDVWGTNRFEVAVRWDQRTDTILLVAVIDNLVKGASGQAVQDMNILFGFPEDAGLDRIGLYP
jgi:N-acetyl-gamma-glutamyl-phosphate reductase